MPARRKASPKDSTATANLDFEAKLWLAADSRSEAETAEGNRSNNMDAAEPSGAKDNHPLGELIDLIGTISLACSGDHRSPSGQGAESTATDDRRHATHRPVYQLGRVYDSSRARKTAAGSPQDEHMGAHQFYTQSCVARCLIKIPAPYTALHGSAFLQSEASPQIMSEAKDKGRIHDPACGSGGMFAFLGRPCGMRFAKMKRASVSGIVQSEKFVESHGAKLGDISIYDQEKLASGTRFGRAKRARRVKLQRKQPHQNNATTRRLAIMNLTILSIDANIGKEHADNFRRSIWTNHQI